MRLYEITPEADQDIEEMANDTLAHWGMDALEEYRRGLKNTLMSIGRGTASERRFFQGRFRTCRQQDTVVTLYPS